MSEIHVGKKCSQCKIYKPLKEFGKDRSRGDGFNCKCKSCAKINRLKNKEVLEEYHKKYRENNRELLRKNQRNHYHKNKETILLKRKKSSELNKSKKRAYNKEYYEKNKKDIKEKRKQYYEKNKKPPNRKLQNPNKSKKELKAEYNKKYRKENRDLLNKKAKKYQESRKKKDKNFRLTILLRGRIGKAIKSQYGEKAYSTIELLGCSIEEVRKHLESLFLPGMSWENHTRTGWHIDHIKPCASFDLTDPEQQKECFHYTNLQPLWYDDNIRKSDKVHKNLK